MENESSSAGNRELHIGFVINLSGKFSCAQEEVLNYNLQDDSFHRTNRVKEVDILIAFAFI